jgi:hypothetical protein
MLLSDLSSLINPVWGFALLGVYAQAAAALAPFAAKYGSQAMGFLKNIFKGKDPMAILGGLGKLASGASGAAKEGRLDESFQQAMIDRQNALMQLQASEFNIGAPNIRASQAARGDLLANVQPVTGTGSGRDYRVTGGLDPSVFGPNTRQAGSLLSSQALQALQSGSDQLSPTMSSIPKSGRLERFLGAAGLAGGIGGAISEAKDRYLPSTPLTPGYGTLPTASAGTGPLSQVPFLDPSDDIKRMQDLRKQQTTRSLPPGPY